MIKTPVKIRRITLIALFAAVISVLAQISIPMPSSVPITLQTFAVAFAGCCLGWKAGSVSVFVYIALGAAGLPVFASFRGGIAVLTGATGGFIAGFLPLAALCGLGASMRRKAAGIPAVLSGLVICHVSGILWYSFVTKTRPLPAAMLVSMPYLVKDALSVLFALYISGVVRAAIKKQ